jgi:hypothetical protein
MERNEVMTTGRPFAMAPPRRMASGMRDPAIGRAQHSQGAKAHSSDI